MSNAPVENQPDENQNAGFEWKGRFYRWHVSDCGKDLLLIDRIANMPVDEFFELIEDENQVLRGAIMLSMVATSIRHGNPTWSVERIHRAVLEGSIGTDFVMIGADEEEPTVPLAEGEPETEEQPSDSSADES